MVLDVVRVEKGRWQDDHNLRIFAGELRERRKNKERIRKETECNGRSGAIQQVQNSTNRGRKRKVQAGIPGKEGNTGKLSLVEILADHFITGACHAPVNIRQGESR